VKEYGGYPLKDIRGDMWLINGTTEAEGVILDLVEEVENLIITQIRLIEELEKADEYSDKLKWKLFWETKDKITKEFIDKRKQKSEEEVIVKELGEEYFEEQEFIKLPKNMSATEYKEWRKG
jgi:hypothetical protein